MGKTCIAWGNAIPKGAYNKYGVAFRRIEIGGLEEHGTFVRILGIGIQKAKYR